MTSNWKMDFPIRAIPFHHVDILDTFWAVRIETNRSITIPFNLEKCEETGRIDSFVKVSDSDPATFSVGPSYNDSDVYKVIEAIAYTLQCGDQQDLQQQADAIIAKVASAQMSNGYLNTTVSLAMIANAADPEGSKAANRPWSDMAHSHELYCAGHLMEAGIAYFEATGKRKLLDVAIRFADHIDSIFGRGKRRDTSGHPEIEIGLAKLFRVTEDPKYLALARFFLDERGRPNSGRRYGRSDDDFEHVGEYAQDHLPLIDQERPVGHAVRACYLYVGAAEIAALSGDATYPKALAKIWQAMIDHSLYITGGIGARHEGESFHVPYRLPNDTAYSETCAAIANVFWNHRLFLLHGEAKYIDVLERILYNALLAGVSQHGNTFFYPNPLSCDGVFAFNKGSALRQPWFECACCPTNVARFFPKIAGYAFAQRDHDIYVNLFMTSQTRFDLKTQTLTLSQETGYPWEGRILIKLDLEMATTFRICIRIPGWARGEPTPGRLYRYLDAGISSDGKHDKNCVCPVCEAKKARRAAGIILINGEAADFAVRSGYATIRRRWSAGDQIEVEFAISIERILSHRKLEENRGRVALSRGPLVYCVEGVDHGGSVADLVLADDAILTCDYRPEFLGGLGVIQGTAIRAGQECALLAIPYYAWAHRGIGEMDVWLSRKTD